MTPAIHGVHYYWLKVTPTATAQVVAVINGGMRNHRVLFLGVNDLSAGDFEFRYPDAIWGDRLEEPAWKIAKEGPKS